MSAIDISVLIISVIGIFLEMWQKPIFWLTYIIAAILLGFEFYSQQLFGSSILQICYLIISVIGWYKWSKDDDFRKSKLFICHTTVIQWLKYLLVTGLLTYILYVFFKYYSDTAPLTDAILTAISLLATYMAIFKQIESWFVFAATTLISVPLYLHSHLYFTAVTFIVFGVLDLSGGVKWLYDYKSGTKCGIVSNTVYDAA